jgi:anti-sigma B factor antagonist
MISAMEQMEFQRIPSQVADMTVFKLTGPFTLATMFAFQAALRESSMKGVIVDLSGVPYMDSAGLGVLLGHWAHTQRAGYKYALVGLSARLHTIFEITHTDQVLPIFASMEDAENHFAMAARA